MYCSDVDNKFSKHTFSEEFNVKCKEMDTFQRMVEKDLTSLVTWVSMGSTPWHDNLTPKAREALKNLENYSTIVIGNLGKGGLVVMFMFIDRKLKDSYRMFVFIRN